MHIKTYQMPSHEVRAILRIGLCRLGGAPTGGGAVSENGAKPPATTAWSCCGLEGAGDTDWIPGAGAGGGDMGAAGVGAGGVGGGAGAGGGGV